METEEKEINISGLNNAIYNLELANGQKWSFTASCGTALWIDRFTSILGLSAAPQNGGRNLIFISSDEEIESLGFTSWRHEKHGFKPVKFLYSEESEDILCELKSYGTNEQAVICMWLALYPVYAEALETGGLPFHSALVEKDGQGFLLAGPGGIGKSTCCRRIPPPWQPLCDDEALIVCDENKGCFVHPFPTWTDYLWRGSNKRWDVHKNVPLKAIFFLDQSSDESASKLNEAQGAAFIYNSASQICGRFKPYLPPGEETDLKKRLLDNACRLARKMPCFVLHVDFNGRFWDQMEKALKDA